MWWAKFELALWAAASLYIFTKLVWIVFSRWEPLQFCRQCFYNNRVYIMYSVWACIVFLFVSGLRYGEWCSSSGSICAWKALMVGSLKSVSCALKWAFSMLHMQGKYSKPQKITLLVGLYEEGRGCGHVWMCSEFNSLWQSRLHNATERRHAGTTERLQYTMTTTHCASTTYSRGYISIRVYCGVYFCVIVVIHPFKLWICPKRWPSVTHPAW